MPKCMEPLKIKGSVFCALKQEKTTGRAGENKKLKNKDLYINENANLNQNSNLTETDTSGSKEDISK